MDDLCLAVDSKYALVFLSTPFPRRHASYFYRYDVIFAWGWAIGLFTFTVVPSNLELT
jgi:hypothetical protein